jgi:hypothetical protein
MTTRSDYTYPEWNTLQSAVVGTAFYIRKLTPGFFDQIRVKYSANKLIDNLEDNHADKFFQQLLNVDNFKSRVPKFVPRSAKGIGVPVLQAIDASLEILEKKDPAKIEPFERLILEIANETADAVDGISPKEQAAINEIIEVLNGRLQVASEEDIVNAYGISTN